MAGLARKLLGRVADALTRERGAEGPGDTARHLAELCALGRCTVGRHTYGRPTVHYWDEGTRLEIGSFTSIAPDVEIFLGGNHRTDWISTYPFPVFSSNWPNSSLQIGHPKSNGDVRIGSDVWLAAGATILSGVSIGSGAVVGARALVTRDVPPYSIVAGNPAKIIRTRFQPHAIGRLLATAWWELPDATIRELTPLLCSADLDGFLERAEQIRQKK